jgi:hypothetical protein
MTQLKKYGKPLKVLLFGALFALNTGLSVYFSINYTQRAEQNRIYEGRYRHFRYDLDASIPFLTLSDNPDILLDNPDRGFRVESYITLGTNLGYPTPNLTSEDAPIVLTSEGAYASLHNQLTLYDPDKPQIIQQYVYLTLFADTPELPASALEQLTEYFEYIRSLQLKILLRFAYTTENNLQDPSQEIMIGHIRQLKHWFATHDQLVADVVYCLQLGFIGFWGEGHSYHEPYDIPRIIGEVFEMIPAWMYMNVRTLEYYYNVPGQYRLRAGIHDDYLIGAWHFWNVFPDDPYQRAYYRNLFKGTINDGEAPWGYEFELQGYRLDAKDFIQTCIDYSLSTLSITHNYIEAGIDKTYAMYHWKSEYLNANTFHQNGWVVNPHLLDSSGQISIFDYLKYHLGYQLVLSNLTLQNGQIGFMISNFGFAAPLNMDQLQLKLTYTDNSSEMIDLTFNPHGLNSFAQLVYFADVDLANLAEAHIKLTNSRNGDYIRFGNSIPTVEGFYRLV